MKDINFGAITKIPIFQVTEWLLNVEIDADKVLLSQNNSASKSNISLCKILYLVLNLSKLLPRLLTTAF